MGNVMTSGYAQGIDTYALGNNNLSTSFGGYHNYDIQHENTKNFYRHLVEFIDIEGKEKESINKMIDSSDSETIEFMKELIKKRFKDFING